MSREIHSLFLKQDSTLRKTEERERTLTVNNTVAARWVECALKLKMESIKVTECESERSQAAA